VLSRRILLVPLLCLVTLALECEDNVPIAPSVTGTVSGAVTVEGEPLAGVSVSLSSGQTTTTDASGGYSFMEVPAGAYTVSISGGPSDVTFSSTAKAATISSAGQVVTVNFDGQYVRSSSIGGMVTVDGEPAESAEVTFDGPDGASAATTGSDGRYLLGSLRAGEYTGSVTGGVAQDVTFEPMTATLTVGADVEGTADFVGTSAPPNVSMALSPEALSAEHAVGSSPCPQDVGTFTITNDGDVTITWGAAAQNGSLDIDIRDGTLEPGESVTVTLVFNCGTQDSFSSTVLVEAQAAGVTVSAEVAVSMSISG